MTLDRIKLLHQYLEKEPDDPFNKYALALEYLKSDPENARKYFEILLKEHPDYLPTYYHSALFYQEIREKEKAEAIFQKGIALATDLGETLALRELKNAYQNFLFEED